MIVVNAHRINKGEYPDCNARDKDFFLLHRSREKDMLQTIKELCLTRLPDYYTDLSPVADIQVLTPVRKGLLGSINLNKELQEVLNPPSEALEERPLATGPSAKAIKSCRSKITTRWRGRTWRTSQKEKVCSTET